MTFWITVAVAVYLTIGLLIWIGLFWNDEPRDYKIIPFFMLTWLIPTLLALWDAYDMCQLGRRQSKEPRDG